MNNIFYPAPSEHVTVCEICGETEDVVFAELGGLVPVFLCSTHARIWQAEYISSREYAALVLARAALDVSIAKDGPVTRRRDDFLKAQGDVSEFAHAWLKKEWEPEDFPQVESWTDGLRKAIEGTKDAETR